MSSSISEVAKSLDLEKNSIKLVTNADLWIAVGKHIYECIKKKSPLKKKELQGYKQLCHFYFELTGNKTIPQAWELDEENCPIYDLNFGMAESKLQSHLKTFNKCDYAFKTQILGWIYSSFI